MILAEKVEPFVRNGDATYSENNSLVFGELVLVIRKLKFMILIFIRIDCAEGKVFSGSLTFGQNIEKR